MCIRDSSYIRPEFIVENDNPEKITTYSNMDTFEFSVSKSCLLYTSCLTAQKLFYQENYPEIEIEKGSIDEVLTMMIRGKAL